MLSRNSSALNYGSQIGSPFYPCARHVCVVSFFRWKVCLLTRSTSLKWAGWSLFVPLLEGPHLERWRNKWLSLVRVSSPFVAFWSVLLLMAETEEQQKHEMLLTHLNFTIFLGVIFF